MATTPERNIFVPGYAENPDMVGPLTSELSERIGEEVAAVDFYHTGDRRLFENQQLSTAELAYRAGKQLGYDGMPDRANVISHSMGARVAAHFTDKPAEVLLAPEGVEAGGDALVKAFTKDTLLRVARPGPDGRFARGQFINLFTNVPMAVELAREMRNTKANFRRNMAARTLVMTFGQDAVTRYPSGSYGAFSNGRGIVSFKNIPDAGHYEPFENPGSVAGIVASYLNQGNNRQNRVL